jgi:glycosyltransferase involved in cell wall biosynthesis
MNRLTAVHLLDDFALGGITKSLAAFDHPELARIVTSRVVAVAPGWSLAPRFDADIIVTHFPPSWRALPFLIALRRRNPVARIIHVEHSYTRAWEVLMVRNRRRFRLMLRLALAQSDCQVAVSGGQADWLAEANGVPRSSIQVVRPWSGTQELDALRPPAFCDRRALVLGAYGRFAHAKGFDVLIDAMHRLDPAKFTLRLAGFGAESAALQARANGAANIEFVGKITDIAAFVAGTDVVVVPSRWEAFGQVAQEARLGSRPVVVASVDGLPEQVGDAGLVVDCSNAATLAAALASLPEQPLAAMAAAGRESVAQAGDRHLAAWAAIFLRVAATGPA